MKPLTLYAAVVLVFYLSMPLYAANMIAYGAGTESVNGTYINMGTHLTDSDDVDYYQRGDIYLYRHDFQEPKAWLIGLNLGSGIGEERYYGVISSNDTPEGLTMTAEVSTDGDPPYPEIFLGGDVIPITHRTYISVRNAGTNAVNGIYTSNGINDGVVYYQKGDIYLYRFYLEGGGTFWIIGTVLGSDHFGYIYYSVLSSNETPDDLTMTFSVIGDPPCPTMKKIIPTISIINLLLN